MTTETTNLQSTEVFVPATLITQCQSTSTAEPSAIAAAVGVAFQKVDAFMKEHGIAASAPPRVIYTEWSPTGVKFTAAVPIAEVPPRVLDTQDVAISALPESTALRFIHTGPYSELRDTYTRIEAWLRARGGIKTPADWARYSPMWEEYLNDPTTTPASELTTRIYLTLS